MDGKVYVYCFKNHLLRMPGSRRIQVAKGAQWVDKDVWETYQNTGLFKLANPPETDAETSSDAEGDDIIDPVMDDEGEDEKDDSEASDEPVDNADNADTVDTVDTEDESEVAEDNLIDVINAFTNKKELEQFAEENLNVKADRRKSLKNMKADLIEKLDLE